MSTPALPIVILISGNGSNLQAIINAVTSGLNVDIKAVISNRPDAYGLERAQHANIPTHVIDHTTYADRNAFDDALCEAIDRYQPKLIVLAGFMRRLGDQFVQHYAGRLINIHPSLLPKYPGLHTHRKVLEAGDREHGITIHFVTEDLDAGPTIAQAKLTVHDDDTEARLKQRIQVLEHQLYPEVLSWFAEGKVSAPQTCKKRHF